MRRSVKEFLSAASVLWLAACQSPIEMKYGGDALEQRGRAANDQTEIGRIAGNEEKQWRGSLTDVEKDEFLEFLQVTKDGIVYFFGDKNGIYSSSDNGISWKSKKIVIPKDSFVSSFVAVDSLHAYASVTASPANALDETKFRSWIFDTVDGGASWQQQFEVSAAEIRRIVVDKDETGWAIGRWFERLDHLTNKPLLFMKKPKENWRKLQPPSELGSIQNIHIDDDLTKTLIDTDGRIFRLKSENEWESIPGISNIKQPQIGISNLNLTGSGDLFLMGSAGGREGTWTSIFIKGKTAHGWNHIKLNNVILRDAVFLQSGEILACGSLRTANLEQRSFRRAVILHSYDGGENWLISFETNQTESFDDLLALNENSILAVGKGKLLRLDKSP